MKVRDALGLVIALALVGLGAYVYYQFQERRAIARFQAMLADPNGSSNFKSGSDLIALFSTAPSVVCKGSGAGFNEAYALVIYHSGEKTRLELIDRTAGTTMHEIISQDAFYVWTDASASVRYVPLDVFKTLQTKKVQPLAGDLGVSLFSSVTCSAWSYNAAAFTLPPRVIERANMN